MPDIKRKDAFIMPNDYVKVTDMGHVYEAQYMKHMNTTANMKKISKTQGVDLRTGEVIDFNLSKNRGNNLNSLRQTFKKLAYLVNNNFHGNKNELWMTLTYAENMTDLKVVAEDFDKALKRLKYYLAKVYGEYQGSLEFLKVLEPQERGAWHIHLLVKCPNLKRRSLYIPNEDLAKIWRKGFVNVKRLKSNDNIGAYLCAYLTNIEAPMVCEDDSPEVMRENMQTIKELCSKPGADKWERTKSNTDKAIIKGGRLHLYPVDMKIFTKSRGLVYPERRVMKYSEFKKKKKIQLHNLTLRKSIEITDKENNFSNVIIIEQYNKKVEKTNILVEIAEYHKNLSRTDKNSFAYEVLKKELYELEHRFEILEKKKLERQSLQKNIGA